MSTFTSLRDVLPLALGKVADRTAAAGTLTPVWAEVVGTAVAKNTRLVALEHGVLRVEAANAQWAAELQKIAPDALRRLQAKAGQVVRSLAFEVRR